MDKTKLPAPRNWVAKHNRHRSQRMRVRTQYQRHAKHRQQESLCRE
jgi:hypothetical protein